MLAVVKIKGLDSVGNRKVRFFYISRHDLGGERMSLYYLENSIIRGEYDEPRIHFALNCQSVGCPRLPNAAFKAEILDQQLEAVTSEFVTNSHKVRVGGDGVPEVSQIFEWFADDFAAAGGVLPFINANGGDVPENKGMRYIPYDWALIAQPGRGP